MLLIDSNLPTRPTHTTLFYCNLLQLNFFYASCYQ